MRITGLEPARRRHQILSLARLPIPPYPHDQHHGTIRRTFHRIKKEPSPGSFLSERAGIRTPDNLIKSQVLYHLSYTPIFLLPAFPCKTNWASWIRTSECRSQSPVPYRLAIAHQRLMSDTACQCEYKRKGWVVGLEPTISRTTIWRANQLHHTHHNEPGGIRTLDLRLRRPLLYPAELQTHINIPFLKAPHLRRNTRPAMRKRVMGIEPTYPAWKAGVLPLNYTRTDRGDRIRTCDLLVPNQAL